MDQMVLETQKWLNETYGKDSRFKKVNENGKTGWPTINALTRALQIELGISNTADNFGPSTQSLFSKKWPSGISEQNKDDKTTSNVYSIIQGALWCKGYSVGSGISQNFYSGTGKAIKKLKADIGIGGDSTVTLDIMKALLSMQQFVLLVRYGGKTEIRQIQQKINKEYKNYTGIIPCDGLYGREMNKGLIKVLQAIEGFNPSQATGNFGNGTKARLKVIYDGNVSSNPKWYWLLKSCLICNNIKVTDTLSDSIKEFQKIYGLTINGRADINTWMSLMISKGNPDRSAKACDCATVLNKQQAYDLKSAGYQVVGRYLTGNVGGSKSKALTLEEINNIQNAGLSVFPIYQDGGYYPKYFANDSQGTIDAQIAISAAKRVGIPKGSVIYFAVDFDAYEFQLNSMIIPYFKKISLVFNSGENDKGYRVGVYGPRLICTRVSNAGYAKFSFVADMSTGFSGNLGHSIPNNWAFDQFHEFSFSSSPTFDLDKDAYSGRDKGIIKFDKVSKKTPEEFENENQLNKINIARTQFVYDVIDPLGLLGKLTKVGLKYNKEIPLNEVSTPNMTIKTSMEAVTELLTASENSYNITIELNNDGTLTTACEDAITKITKDSRLKVGGDRVKDSITDIATSVKSGDIALTIKFPLPNQVEFNIEVMSKDLLPTSEELDEYITVIVKHLITFYDNTVKEPVISEDGLIFGVAVIGVIAICIFFPESILSIPELLGGVGILSAV